MTDYYEINISKNGKHFFATAERSCRTIWETAKVFAVLKEKFPVSEGYQISVDKWEGRGHCALSEIENEIEKNNKN